MKKRTILLIVALLPCFSFLLGSSIFQPNSVPDKPIDIDVEGIGQPRSINPDCFYLNGNVYIVADSSVTSISGTVTRLSDNAQWSDSSTGCMLQIAVPTDPATYRLTLTFSDGSSYYGDYTLTL